MKESDWERITHFSPKENWGDPQKMSFVLIRMLDEMRERSGSPIIIHEGYATSGHSPNSYHYQGRAVDFHIQEMDLLDQYLWAERLEFRGIGVYPYWNNPGLHVDIRAGKKAAWARTKDGVYVSLTARIFLGGR